MENLDVRDKLRYIEKGLFDYGIPFNRKGFIYKLPFTDMIFNPINNRVTIFGITTSIYGITSSVNWKRLFTNIKKVAKAYQIFTLLMRLNSGLVVYDVVKLITTCMI